MEGLKRDDGICSVFPARCGVLQHLFFKRTLLDFYTPEAVNSSYFGGDGLHDSFVDIHDYWMAEMGGINALNLVELMLQYFED